jgi:O-antigen ligase
LSKVAASNNLWPNLWFRRSRFTFFSGGLFLQLMIISAVFLPFTKALTLSIGFPLKVYEIFLAIAILLFLLKGKVIKDSDLKHLFFMALFFFTVAFFSTLAGQFDSGANPAIDFRGGRLADGLMRAIYLLFNILTFVVAFKATNKAPRLIINAWFLGLFLAASYHFITLIFIFFTGDAPLLMGLERHQMGWVGEMLVPRSGTFEEGNFAGLFYLCGLALATYVRNRFMIIISVAAILLTLSTSTYLALIAYIAIYLLRRNGLSLANLFILLTLSTLIFWILFGLNFVSKFGGGAGSSGAVRLNEAITGLQIFSAHPSIGVGLGGYGFYFDAFEWDSALSISFGSAKHIPNNIYIELLAETGVLGFVLFFSFLYSWARIIAKGGRELDSFYAIVISIFIVFLAYPTFNITYLWYFLGLTLGLLKVSNTMKKVSNGCL